jgi:general secretion pathway protein I
MIDQSARVRRCGGFSLLEMMVAIAILALALGSLYQAASGATRNVRAGERYAYGVELARSLLANNVIVPERGLNSSGETSAGYSWHVVSTPRQGGRNNRIESQLQDLEVSVSWFDGSKKRSVVLHSVVEGLSR